MGLLNRTLVVPTRAGRHISLTVASLALAAGCASAPSPRTSPPTTAVETTTTSRLPSPTTSPTTPPTTTTPPTSPAQPPSSTTTNGPGPAKVITRGATNRKVVALTFDAGSDPGYTTQILADLAAQGVPATFGITGLWAQANPDLVRRIAAAGHQIVNHSWDHQSFTGVSTNSVPLTGSQIDQELSRTESLLRQVAGTGSSGWFRPPYGDRNPTVDASAGAVGYRWELLWTVDTLGWKGVSPATVVQRALAALGPGEIILMHVGSASTDAAALAALISAVRAQGYSFVTAASLV